MTARRNARAGVLAAAAMTTALLGGGEVRAETPDLAWLDDRAAVQQFVDGVMGSRIARGDVVGATVAIVHGGEPVLARGYGLADLEASRGVDAEQTLFRVGSISKVFVWMGEGQPVALEEDVPPEFFDDTSRVWVEVSMHCSAAATRPNPRRPPSARRPRSRLGRSSRTRISRESTSTRPSSPPSAPASASTASSSRSSAET